MKLLPSPLLITHKMSKTNVILLLMTILPAHEQRFPLSNNQVKEYIPPKKINTDKYICMIGMMFCTLLTIKATTVSVTAEMRIQNLQQRITQGYNSTWGSADCKIDRLWKEYNREKTYFIALLFLTVKLRRIYLTWDLQVLSPRIWIHCPASDWSALKRWKL